jgi:hypothetical protein
MTPAVAPDTRAAKVGIKARSESLVAMMTLSMGCAVDHRSAAPSAMRKRAAPAWFS